MTLCAQKPMAAPDLVKLIESECPDHGGVLAAPEKFGDGKILSLLLQFAANHPELIQALSELLLSFLVKDQPAK